LNKKPLQAHQNAEEEEERIKLEIGLPGKVCVVKY
jgi:hypothetical protein